MRIAFYDTIGLRYHAQSVDSIPLGGSESAACHLARALARMGHQVILMTKLSEPGTYDGVWCIPHPFHAMVPWPQLDAVVWMGPPIAVQQVRAVAPQARLIFWTQHAVDQPWVQFLREPRGSQLFDGYALVSEWQRAKFIQTFALPIERTVVMRNAVGFAFESMFTSGESILAAKSRPPVLAYTSTPFRGLDVLLDAFPMIRQTVPDVRLKVFSSMRVYQTPVEQETAYFGELYRRCLATPGVEYVGSVAQPELARAMRQVSMLSYPNTFAETSCIAVMEALASGCRVVTSDLAALPETAAGFARLVKPDASRESYLANFVEQAVLAIQEFMYPEGALERSLQNQVEWFRQNATWRLRATQWVEWLSGTRRSA
ncbi:MAG TPA: glycosyltransferase family 4 protein [Tepidisphaeraceae bacterium]|nr:glycosyltransferase family 4 protein [Tepidisphaeraceae bacterium]